MQFAGKCPDTNLPVHICPHLTMRSSIPALYAIVRKGRLRLGEEGEAQWTWQKYGNLFNSMGDAMEAFRTFCKNNQQLNWKDEF